MSLQNLKQRALKNLEVKAEYEKLAEEFAFMKKKLNSPSPEQIKQVRLKTGQSPEKAADSIGATARAWQYWEKGEREMNGKLFEMYLIQTGQHPTLRLSPLCLDNVQELDISTMFQNTSLTSPPLSRDADNLPDLENEGGATTMIERLDGLHKAAHSEYKSSGDTYFEGQAEAYGVAKQVVESVIAWQPMHTAPKALSPILVYYKTIKKGAESIEQAVAYFAKNEWWINGTSYTIEPLGWMPLQAILPSPPPTHSI